MVSLLLEHSEVQRHAHACLAFHGYYKEQVLNRNGRKPYVVPDAA
jgi:hypothetical protein